MVSTCPILSWPMGLASIQGQEMYMNDLIDGWGEKVKDNVGTKDKLP